MKKLTAENALEVFRNNEALKNRVYGDALENEAYFMAGEVLQYFETKTPDGRRVCIADYDISMCSYSYIKPRQGFKKEFIEACIDIANDYGIMDDLHNVRNKLQRVHDKIDFFEDVTAGYGDISDANYYRLEKWIDETIEEAADYIKDYVIEFYDQFLDDETLEEYFINVWLDYNDGLEVDNTGRVYETITRVIA